MFEIVAYFAAQQQTLAHTREALPDEPVRSHPAATRIAVRPVLLRQQMSATLRRRADIIEPKPECATPAPWPC
jgi:hypothetical protein